MRKIKIILSLICFTVIMSCSESDDNILSVKFSITHDTYSNIQSPYTTIEIRKGNGDVLDREVNVGGNNGVTWSKTIEVASSGSSEEIILFSSREGGKEVSINVSNGDSVTWNTAQSSAHVSSSGSSDGLVGTWRRVGACTNSSGTPDTFSFNANKKGSLFQADCNSACAGGGITTQFSYSVSGSSLSVTPTSVGDYCGNTPTLSVPFTLSWSISGDTLTMDGVKWKRG